MNFEAKSRTPRHITTSRQGIPADPMPLYQFLFQSHG